VLALCAAKKVPTSRVDRSQLDRLGDGHQGVALRVGEYQYADLGDIHALADDRREDDFLLILDALQDPQNLGTLLRSGEAVGIHGVIIPYRRTATVTPAVVSASSGACEHLLIAQANLAQSIDSLKDAGVWVAGLESGPQARLPGEIRLDGPLALVVGNEGQGMRPLVRTKCDFLLRLPMRGRVESLNAAVAGSVGLYLAWQARQFAGSR
jgi:23S rRNA (guanosine2251-2'-O)-methyltransferase